MRAIICIFSQVLVEVPNSSLDMEHMELCVETIRAESVSIHPIAPARGRAAREHIHRDGNWLRPGCGPTDSAVPVTGQGRMAGC